MLVKKQEAAIHKQNGRYRVKEKEKERKRVKVCWPTLCSSLLSPKPPVWASAGVSGFALAPPTQCHVTLAHHTPLQLQRTQWKEMARGKREREKERKQEAYLPDKARTHRHTHKAKRPPVYLSPVLNWEKTEQEFRLSSTNDLWVLNYLSRAFVLPVLPRICGISIIQWEILREIILFTHATSGLLSLWGLSIGVMVFILYKPYILSYGKLTENSLHFYILKKTHSVWFTSFFISWFINSI